MFVRKVGREQIYNKPGRELSAQTRARFWEAHYWSAGSCWWLPKKIPGLEKKSFWEPKYIPLIGYCDYLSKELEVKGSKVSLSVNKTKGPLSAHTQST